MENSTGGRDTLPDPRGAAVSVAEQQVMCTGGIATQCGHQLSRGPLWAVETSSAILKLKVMQDGLLCRLYKVGNTVAGSVIQSLVSPSGFSESDGMYLVSPKMRWQDYLGNTPDA